MPTIFKDKNCLRCGKPLPNVAAQTRFCPDCRIKKRRRTHHQCRRCGKMFPIDGKTLCPECRLIPPPSEMKQPRPIICSSCGKLFFHTAKGKAPKCCPDCKKKEINSRQNARRALEREYNAQNDAWLEQYVTRKQEPRKQEPWMTIGKKKKNQGLRYGKIVADELLKQQAKEMAERRKLFPQ